MWTRPSSSETREWQDDQNSDNDLSSGLVESMAVVLSWLVVILSFPISLFFCFNVVHEYERMVVFRFGRRKKEGGSTGVCFNLPCVESYKKVDMRSTVFKILPQEVLTKDSVTVTVEAVLYYRICDADKAVTKVANPHSSTRLLGQATLRGVLGQRELGDLLAERDSISAELSKALDKATKLWGIKVSGIEITDVRLPLELQRAMAIEGEAEREAKARLIAADGEHKAAWALKEAADIMIESPASIQLRYLHTLVAISAENNKTVNFPLPLQLISDLSKNCRQHQAHAQNQVED